ncbi:MAG TPA: argininosuccinate lyase [Candidatus Thermoplasmatota archaeon]
MAARKPWGGRFREPTHPLVEAYTSSVAQDARLAEWDIVGSIAHARMLGRAGILRRRDEAAVVRGLKGLHAQARAGKLRLDPRLEDVHMNVERQLVRRVGGAGERLHAGRSRNDQVALDTRLAAREGLVELGGELEALQKALVALAARHEGVPLLGRTHMQPAQAVLLSHHLLAYREKFGRDTERVLTALAAADMSPLGSAALAGTALRTDPHYTARLLGFAEPAANSLDAVSDRDYIADAAYASTMVLIHLSQLSEEVVFWSTEAFGYVTLPDAFSTGSSLMPQKRNPDVAELTRGRAALAVGDLAGLLTLLKGLPLAYNRDLQEDKHALFRTVDLATRAAEVYAAFLPRLRFNRDRLAAGFHEGFAGATDLAEHLVERGVPFRQAHEVVGRIVRDLDAGGRTLASLTPRELASYSPRFEAGVLGTLDPKGSAGKRSSHGGTAPSQVRSQLARARGHLAEQRKARAVYARKVAKARALAGTGRLK